MSTDNTNLRKTDVLRTLTFGARIAEDEADALSSYFVETDQWSRIYSGDIDVIYGAKGAGKSAIYSLLLARADQLFDRGIITVAAENPRGTPVFKDLTTDPPASEDEFRGLWKLYLLSLLGSVIREYKFESDEARRVVAYLQDSGLLPKQVSLRVLLRAAVEYTRRLLRAEALETGVNIDPADWYARGCLRQNHIEGTGTSSGECRHPLSGRAPRERESSLSERGY